MSLTRFLNRDRWDQERARELDAHLAIEIDDNIARGMSPAAAHDAARRKLGNATLVREEIYQMNTVTLIDSDWLPTIVPDSEPGRIQVPAPPASVTWNLALNSAPPTREGEQ